jgi:hypothetical protein
MKYSPKNAVVENCETELFKVAIKNGFLTGSKKFGLDTKDSDYDYVVKLDDVSDYINFKNLESYNKNSNLPTCCLFAKVKGKLFNFLITENDDEYSYWVKSTEQFLKLMENDFFAELAKDKYFRTTVFEFLREKNGLKNKPITCNISNKTVQNDEVPF